MEMVRIGLFTATADPDHLGGHLVGVVVVSERSGTGRRARSEIRSSRATITQLATSDEPP